MTHMHHIKLLPCITTKHMTIYRLRPCNKNTIDELKNNYFWFAKPTEFNDCEDSNIISFAEKNSTIREVFEHRFDKLDRIKHFTENVGICCFTENLPKLNAWKRFPKCSNGIAIEYNKENLKDFYRSTYGIGDCFKKVEYYKEPTIFEALSPYHILWNVTDGDVKEYKSLLSLQEKDMDLLFLKMFTRLNKKYKRQKELRIILNEQIVNTHCEAFTNGYKITLPNREITRIYYKSTISKSFLEELKSLGIELIEKNNAG